MPNILGVKRLSAQGDMNNRWGEKCPDFEPLCAACQAWKHYEATGRIPQVRTVDKMTDANSARINEMLGR